MIGAVEIVKDKASKEPFASEKGVGAKLCAAMRDKGVMMRPLGDVIVLTPPVAIDIETLEKLLDIIGDVIKNELPKIIEGTQR
jgi:adenosylmethionine-8-amino-7-oxononanoate aminotransferase